MAFSDTVPGEKVDCGTDRQCRTPINAKNPLVDVHLSRRQGQRFTPVNDESDYTEYGVLYVVVLQTAVHH